MCYFIFVNKNNFKIVFSYVYKLNILSTNLFFLNNVFYSSRSGRYNDQVVEDTVSLDIKKETCLNLAKSIFKKRVVEFSNLLDFISITLYSDSERTYHITWDKGYPDQDTTKTCVLITSTLRYKL